MSKHDRAVRSLIKQTQRDHDVAETKASDVDRYPDPKPIGENNEEPDIVFEFSNGHTRIVEVDTKPMSEHDKKQDETFRRSAGLRTGTTYEHYFAGDVL